MHSDGVRLLRDSPKRLARFAKTSVTNCVVNNDAGPRRIQ
jgi:hypothetical protein